MSVDFKPQTITIYSVGLLGGSLGLALRQTQFEGRIIGLSSPASIRTALERNCIDEGYDYDALPEILNQTDLLFLCSPISGILDAIKRLRACELPQGIIISDIGSTKQEILQAAQGLPPNCFIGGHPMAGSEKSGCAHADPYLFQNAIYVLTPPAGRPSEQHQAFGNFLDKHLGSRHCFLDPATHDTVVAMVSHLPHLAAVALVNCAASVEHSVPGTLSLAAGGFKDMTRIASAPYGLWKDILGTNKTAIIKMLENYTRTLADFKGLLERDALEERFNAAALTRQGITSSSKGFIHPISEIMVQAPDKPGIIALIATTLAEENINIKDIEVVKVREGEGGTIRLAFDSREIAQRAIELLHTSGLTARERQ